MDYDSHTGAALHMLFSVLKGKAVVYKGKYNGLECITMSGTLDWDFWPNSVEPC